jgi:hypothetical protein
MRNLGSNGLEYMRIKVHQIVSIKRVIKTNKKEGKNLAHRTKQTRRENLAHRNWNLSPAIRKTNNYNFTTKMSFGNE